MVRSLGLAAAIVVAFLNGAALSEGAVACEAPEFAFRGELRGLLPGPYGPATTAGTSWRVSLVADIDGDGRTDLVAGSWVGTLTSSTRVLVAHGDGSFELGPGLGGGFYSASVVVPVELNGDGVMDLVSLESFKIYSWTVYPFIRLPAGGWTEPSLATCSHAEYATLAFGDLTGDGKADLAYVSGGTVNIDRETASGRFERLVSFPTSTSRRDVVIFDVDGDGKQDLVLGPTKTEPAQWWAACPPSKTRQPVAPGPVLHPARRTRTTP